MAKSLEVWKNQVFGETIDLDNQSFDCVDVSKSWIVYLTDVRWQDSAGWGNAKDIYSYWSSEYLDKIPRGNAPKLGDIIVMNGTIGGGYGHTGVVVGIDGQNVTIYQQNTFTQQPVYTGVYNAYASYITGFLRPNENAPFTIDAVQVVQPYQRVASYAAKYRDAPNSNANLLDTFADGESYDFKGFIHGENVDGNDIWFVGRYTGGYVWSGAFKDTGTHDLPDLTPTISLQSFQRQVGNSIINYRREPKVMPDNVIKTFNPGEILDFDAWTHGALVDGTDVWFRGKYTQGWSHAGGFTNQTTDGLTEVKLETVPVPAEPIFPAPTSDPEVTRVYNKKHPLASGYAPTDLVSVGGGQTLRKEAADSLKLMQQQTQTLICASGYRSYATQQAVYANEVVTVGQEQADRESARPGYSEHQTGLVMDFSPIEASFESSSAYTWLTVNAYKYGWILRYTAPKEAVTGYMSEPWHWRYVGVTVATDMHNKGILTLEEYFGVEGGGYKTEPPVPTDPTPVEPNDPTKNPLFAIFENIVKFLSDIITKLKKK